MTINLKRLAITTIILTTLCPAGWATDWTQFRGPNHDGSSPEKIRDLARHRAA